MKSNARLLWVIRGCCESKSAREVKTNCHLRPIYSGRFYYVSVLPGSGLERDIKNSRLASNFHGAQVVHN
jgi:hypothetical protein